ncbi:unnamed protein product [Spirodela intermedia]|uniref:Uncharacterized protein n=2 Tax=Spirodela intermedia TaxID=51605 RepID=A0A7I8J2V9_SPIIN|nr:unnamed protein product [Spirodela intermedia]CAA6664565.1 unnamed protein product [Spirodela intermedia]CAA7401156.1 unnamed protein product [Spirodela intermedia]
MFANNIYVCSMSALKIRNHYFGKEIGQEDIPFHK